MCDRFLYDKVETLRVIKDCIEGLPKSICECISILVYSRPSSPAQDAASQLLSPIDRYHNACFKLSIVDALLLLDPTVLSWNFATCSILSLVFVV